MMESFVCTRFMWHIGSMLVLMSEEKQLWKSRVYKCNLNLDIIYARKLKHR